jgi:exopolysaccharide biosynthesis WecB/TagA/CpsF family protein
MQPKAFGKEIYNGSNCLEDCISLIESSPGIYLFSSPSLWSAYVENNKLEKILNKARINFCDGIGTMLCCAIQSQQLPVRIKGPDLTDAALKSWKDKEMVFLVWEETGFKKLKEKYQLSQSHCIQRSEQGMSKEAITKDISKIKKVVKSPMAIWVCLGSPKQEYWAMEAKEYFPKSRLLPIGAAFDFVSGNKRRCPVKLQNWGLEWAYRFWQEPKRLFGRTLFTNAKMIFYSLIYRDEPNTPILKRIADITIGSLGLLVSVPIVLISSLLIWWEDGFTPIFKQRRIGKDGKPFTFYKLRSMVPNAEKYQAPLKELNEYKNGIPFKISGDPRITSIGKFLRRWSLDELPQIWNVLTGDMSLVGPRPALPEEVNLYSTDQRKRLGVLPGITGLWQINAREKRCFDKQVDYDLKYIEEQSPIKDLKIIIKTIPRIISGDGAH